MTTQNGHSAPSSASPCFSLPDAMPPPLMPLRYFRRHAIMLLMLRG